MPVRGDLFNVEIRAFGGRDGQPLWSHSLPPRAPWGGNIETAFPRLSLGDLDGDSVPEVVAVDHVPDMARSLTVGQSGKQAFLAIVLDGRTGLPRGETWPFRENRPPFEPPPNPTLVDLDGQGRHLIALLIREEPTTRLVLLDDRGQVRHERTFPEVQPLPWSPSLSACDLDGDGADELVSLLAIDGSTIQVFRRDLVQPLWSRTLAGPGRLTEVRPGTPDHPGCVVFGGKENTVVGLDGETGRDRWRGQAGEGRPGPESNGSPLFNAQLLHSTRPGDLPRIISGTDSFTTCSLTLPADRSEEGLVPDHQPAVLRPAAPDPRQTRPLPWTAQTENLLLMALFVTTLALFLLALPALALAWVVRRRPVRLGRLMLVPVILGLTLAVVRACQPSSSLGAIFLHAAMGLPLVVLSGLSALWLLRRQWRRLLVMAVLVVVAAACLAAFQIHDDAPQRSPWQSYSWEGWYWIIAPALYGVGLLMTAWMVLGTTARMVWRGLNPLKRRPRAA